MKKHFRLLALLVVVAMMTSAFAACGTTTSSSEPETDNVTWSEWKVVTEATCVSAGLKRRTSSEDEVETEAIPALGHNFKDGVCTRCGLSADDISVLTYGEDYVSLYEQLGSDATIADVEEDADGKAYIYVKNGEIVAKDTEGAVKTELGMDFLSMAMVYNVTVPEGSDKYKTEDDVYAEWWKLYIQRWNMLLPEVPLYSNQYYDMYNKKLGGVKDHPTNPYWNPANALIDWTSSDDKIIIGSSTDLSGKFRYSNFGANNPGASDNDVSGLVNGLSTVASTKEGGYVWDEKTVVESHEETQNEDGTLTFTIEIKEGLKFSDGSAITAKNYLLTVMLFSTPVAAEAAGKDHKAGMSYVGYKEFAAYDGTNNGATITPKTGDPYKASKAFKGIRLLGDYEFSATVSKDYAGYFYKILQGAFSPEFIALWVGTDVDIKDDGDGVYFTDNFYAKSADKYTKAATIKAAAANTDTTYPYSGAYVVKGYDASKKEATLEKNDYYPGNYEGTKPQIKTVVYKKIISKTQLADFKANGVDVLSAITGGDATDEALAYAYGADGEADTEDDLAIVTTYARAGYGKLGFRADFGPVQFTAVRQAIALCLDRAEFARQFTGGYGGVVNGPYYTNSWMYTAVKDIKLESYSKSADDAKALLEADGWIYDEEGNPYSGRGVRYKKFLASEITERDRNYAAKDGSYETVYDEENDCYYMPLVLNWFGTEDNEFSDILVKDMVLGDAFKAAGFVVKYTLGDFSPMLDELYQAQVYGYYGGTPTYTCFNFATGFNSAVYDYAYNWTIDPAMYDDYSLCYLKDSADIYRLPKAAD